MYVVKRRICVRFSLLTQLKNCLSAATFLRWFDQGKLKKLQRTKNAIRNKFYTYDTADLQPKNILSI